MALVDQFVSAAFNGDWDQVAQLLDHPFEPSPSEPTALHVASWSREMPLPLFVKILATARDVDVFYFGMTPLMYAATRGCVQRMQLLLEAGADPKAADPYGGATALISACDSNASVDCVKLLIDAGCDVDAHGWYIGETTTPLICATKRGNVQVARLLLASGANAKLVVRGSSAIDWCTNSVEMYSFEMFKLLAPVSDTRSPAVQVYRDMHGTIEELQSRLAEWEAIPNHLQMLLVACSAAALGHEL